MTEVFSIHLHAPTPNPPSSGSTWTLMTFEDDTVRVIPKNLVTAQPLLSDWYNEIEYFMNFETLVLALPPIDTKPIHPSQYYSSALDLSLEDYKNLTHSEIPVSLKESFIQNYVPLKLQQLQLTKKLASFEKNFLDKVPSTISHTIKQKLPDPKQQVYPFHQQQLALSSSSCNEKKEETPLPETTPCYQATRGFIVSDRGQSGGGEPCSTTTQEPFETLVVETFSKKPSITLKVPKTFEIHQLSKNTIESSFDLAYPHTQDPVKAFSGWGPGPYGMQSCSSFASNCLELDSKDTSLFNTLESSLEIHVFFHLKSMKTLVHLESCPFDHEKQEEMFDGRPQETRGLRGDDGGPNIVAKEEQKDHVKEQRKILELIAATPQCGFVRLFKLCKKPQFSEKAMEMFHNQFHLSVEELNTRIESFYKKILDLEKISKENQKVTLEVTQIKTYLLRHYELNNDLNYKVKASTLCQEIQQKLLYDPEHNQGLNVRLSNYLKEMGLQKKRYNDGYYYYGLKPKPRMHTTYTTPF